VRLSPCTLVEAVRLCAPDVFENASVEWVNDILNHPAWEVAGHRSMCSAELHYGRALSRIRLDGCTVEQALLFCGCVVEFDGAADNYWLDGVMPEPTVFAVLTQLGWR